MITATIALLLATQAKPVPYTVLGVTEAKSPQPPHAKLIRDKRHAFEFFYLVKEGAKKPQALKKIDWRKNSVLVVYPGLLPEEAKVSLSGLARKGTALTPSVLVQNAKGEANNYPILLLKVPRQPASIDADNVMVLQPKIDLKVTED